MACDIRYLLTESQKWRHASNEDTTKRLLQYHTYLPELANRHFSLNVYSICERHYNQAIATNQFYQHLVGSVQENKRLRFEDNPTNYIDSIADLDEAKKHLKFTQLENQKNEIVELKKQLQRAQDNMIKIQSLYDEQCKNNEVLIRQWNSRFADQQKRIEAIVEIANMEHSTRFSMENLVMYSPHEWLNRRNKVVVAFIETLIQNTQGTKTLGQEKLFKTMEVIDKELYNYLSDILNLLSEEKLSSTNTIDSLISSTGINITNIKQCPKCHQQNIENRKKICPKCKTRLPTLTEIQKEKITEVIQNTTNNTLIFKPYSFDDKSSAPCIPRISITQQQVVDQRVNIPEIYVPDPIDINPNSISNVEKDNPTNYIDSIADLDEAKKHLKFTQLENQKNEIVELKKQLQRAQDNMIKIQSLYDEQCKNNEVLIRQWNSRFADQQKRIEAIVEIANMEHSTRFSMENLVMYSPHEWLNRRNKVVVAFIETLIQNTQGTKTLGQEKLFKTMVAVDSIYGARHGKYVSEIQLALSAIKYSIARSKMIINIDNHITSSGSYYRFQKWLEELSKQEEPLPEGFLFLAFDNEQRGQKNYLDRGYNTVVYHIVTSFVAFNMELYNRIQHTDSPWVYSSLNKLQHEELFDVNPQMQEVIDKELYNYLSDILNLLSEEKLSSTNTIDSLISSTGINITNIKQCPKCHQQNIENRKKICPKCKTRLPTLTEIQKEKITEVIQNTTNNTLIFKPYSFDDKSSAPCIPRISITQQQVVDQRVNIPEIYVPDPIDINPNSISNVEKVLLHIEKITGIRDGILLIPGQLHEEMNMLRAFVEEIDIKRFATCQGYRTDNQLSYFKKCADHHKSWDSICNIYQGYLAWVKKQQESLYQIKYEQTFIYLQAIINYRKAIRTNNPLLKRAARRIFSSIWSARRHPIYRLIEVADEIQLMRLRPEVRDLIEKNCVISRSEIYEQHQGLDAILEEVNKTLKTLIPPVPQYHHWKIAARNCKKFLELRNNLFKIIGYNDYQTIGPRTRPESSMECQRFRTYLRNLEFVNQSLEEYELNENLKNFTDLAKQARQKFITEVFINKHNSPLFRSIPITKQEAKAQESEENMTKSEIYEQHQGLDAILEEVNKTLKTLIPPVPQYHHWKIAARNCKKFLELRNNLFKIIGYNDYQTIGPRTRPESSMECQRFRTYLRNLEFVNQSLEEYELNENLKNFTDLAKQARQKFITEVFINKHNSPLFRSIPITKQEAKAQESEENMTKSEILLRIETLLEQLGKNAQKKYSGLKLKKPLCPICNWDIEINREELVLVSGEYHIAPKDRDKGHASQQSIVTINNEEDNGGLEEMIKLGLIVNESEQDTSPIDNEKVNDNEQDLSKDTDERDIVQSLLGELSTPIKGETVEAMIDEDENNKNSAPKNLSILYQKACRAEMRVMKAKQEEITCWYYYGKGEELVLVSGEYHIAPKDRDKGHASQQSIVTINNEEDNGGLEEMIKLGLIVNESEQDTSPIDNEKVNDNEQDLSKDTDERDIVQSLLGELSTPIKGETVEAMIDEDENNKNSAPKNLSILYQKACRAEMRVMKAKQEEITCWYYYGKGFEERVEAILNNERGVRDQSARNRVYNKIVQHILGYLKDNLRKKTQRAVKIYKTNLIYQWTW
ncbi:hypothetical protein Glove_85g68 [Diversispora epigaea]|uniref:Uncharacterized protein n=1 Tax=Diversispora epigaea TaxID=1348612 RepID=A0A397JHQ3_9GLOM|nr:hypothetical protein Glove_85g68 [Diversispora epigaea]